MPEASPAAIVLGCSAGGVTALRTVLAGLSPPLPVPVIVVCHTGGEELGLLCEVLASASALPVREAIERQWPQASVVHLAPAGYHLLIEADGRFALSVDARVCYSRPAIDVLFETAARYYRERLIGVVMTGANDDGAAGLKAIRVRGGIGIVQTPDSAEARAMPEAALALAGADHVKPLADIAPLLNHLCPS
jgi:two-component system chemotaxis response regulator CheB